MLGRRTNARRKRVLTVWHPNRGTRNKTGNKTGLTDTARLAATTGYGVPPSSAAAQVDMDAFALPDSAHQRWNGRVLPARVPIARTTEPTSALQDTPGTSCGQAAAVLAAVPWIATGELA